MDIENDIAQETQEVVGTPVLETETNLQDDPEFVAMVTKMAGGELDVQKHVEEKKEVENVNEATKQQKIDHARELLKAKELGKEFQKIKEEIKSPETTALIKDSLKAEIKAELEQEFKAEKLILQRENAIDKYTGGDEDFKAELIKTLDRLKPTEDFEADIKAGINLMYAESNLVKSAEYTKAETNKVTTARSEGVTTPTRPDYGNLPGMDEFAKLMGL